MLKKEIQRIISERKKNAKIIDLGYHDNLRWEAKREGNIYQCWCYCQKCKIEGYEAPCSPTQKTKKEGKTE